MAIRAVQQLIHNKSVREFIKFYIVGLSSSVIKLVICSWLIYGVNLDKTLHTALADQPELQQIADHYHLYLQIVVLIGSIVALINSFIWNSRWTFRSKSSQLGAPTTKKYRYLKYIIVNIIGLLLNQILVFFMMAILTPGPPQQKKGIEPLLAIVTSAIIVVIWNFSANKYWVFGTAKVTKNQFK